jgi:hypothetical protein
VNFFAHPLRKFAWTFRVAELLEGHLDLAGNLAAARRCARRGTRSGAVSALAARGQADGGSQSCGGQDELTSAHGSPHLSASLELAAKDCCPTETGLTVNRRGESNARFRW